MLIWKYVKPLREKGVVEKFLRDNNILLSDEIVACLKENNGGRPMNEVFDTDKSKERIFKALLSYNKTDRETIYSCYPGIFREKGLFPLATDPAGNFISVDLRNNNAIIFFELESGTKEFIANTIGELVEKLY